MDWTEIYLLIFFTAFFLSILTTPLCKRLAWRWKILDVPKCEQHKLHARATPLLGGLAMFSAWLLTILLACLCRGIQAHFFPELTEGLKGVPLILPNFIILLLCAGASVALGLYDDRHSMKAWKKLIGQILIAAVTAAGGGVSITLFIGIPAVSYLITVFWIVLIFNAINFFDNMDGLAVGTSTIAFLFFAFAAAVNQQYFVASLAALSAGAGAGFWLYNRSPASIFMGDSGSHLLGYLLAVVSAKVTYYTPGVSTTKFTMLIPLFILAIPLLDTLTVVLIRLYNHKPIYVGDHNHISHRFLHMGLTRPQAVTMVHLLSLIAGLGALPLLWGETRTCFLLIVQGLLIFALISYLQFILHKKEQS